jgi:hypothetical protein
MATAKRLYLYSVSGIGLGLVLYAATILMGLLFDKLGLGASLPYSAPAGVQANRELLSLAIGLVAVGLPLWLFHWALVERMVSGDEAAAAVERQSIVRAVYFGLLLLILVSQLAQSGVDVLHEAIVRPLGAGSGYYPISLSGALAGLVAYLGAFLYHAWIRARDIRQGPTIMGAAAWGSRLFHYGLAVGLMIGALYAVGTVIVTAGQALTAGGQSLGPTSSNYYYGGLTPPPASSAPWWVFPLVGALASVVVYGALWLAHWRYAAGLAARVDDQGVDERASRVRLTYFVLVVASVVGYSFIYLSQALGLALQFVVGLWHAKLGQPLWAEILVSLLAALPIVAGWWWHRRRATREWASQPGTALRAIRPLDYFTSLIGIAVFGASLAMFIAAIGQKVTGFGLANVSADAWRSQAVGTIELMAVAAPIWLWPWLAGQRRLAINPLGEKRSTARKAFLLAVAGGTVIAGAGSLGFILYRLTRIAVGLNSSSLGEDVRMPLCILAVSVGLLAYHLYWIRRDQDAVFLVGEDVQVPAPADVATPAHELVVVGPAGADLEALRASLAERLPDGFLIVVRPREGTA